MDVITYLKPHNNYKIRTWNKEFFILSDRAHFTQKPTNLVIERLQWFMIVGHQP